jgi:hypothetical protein
MASSSDDGKLDPQAVTNKSDPQAVTNKLDPQPITKKQKPSSDGFCSIDEKTALLQSPTKLPPMLENARLEDVSLYSVKSTTTGEDIEVMMCVAGVDLDKPSMKQLRMLCSKWKMKKYRPAKKQEILELIATHQKMRQFYKETEQR